MTSPRGSALKEKLLTVKNFENPSDERKVVRLTVRMQRLRMHPAGSHPQVDECF